MKNTWNSIRRAKDVKSHPIRKERMMLKTGIFSGLLWILLANAAHAGETFFERDINNSAFKVYGIKASKLDNGKIDLPACYAELRFNDGSVFQLIRNLDKDADLYMYIKNNSWEIEDKIGSTGEAQFNFFVSGSIDGRTFQYELINKNTIVISGIYKDKFTPIFMSADYINIVMPGNISNAKIVLSGSSDAVQEISNCIQASKLEDLYPQGLTPDDTDPKVKL